VIRMPQVAFPYDNPISCMDGVYSGAPEAIIPADTAKSLFQTP
jgi:hypothetical protein